MKRVLVNNNIYNIISNNIISKEELINYINDIIKENNLSNNIKNVVITKLDNNMGAYNSNELSLKINYDNIIYYADFNYNKQNLKINKNKFINLYMLMVIAHEITHVIQFIENNSIFYDLFIKENNYSEKHYNTYLKYHDNFAFEREAKINSIENVIYLIKENDNDKDLLEYYFLLLTKTLKLGYSYFKSPSKLIRKLFNNKVEINNLDIYDKMKYGFNISNKELNNYNKNYNMIVSEKLALN